MDIYVGNLAYSTTDDELRELFAAHGAVSSARVCIDRMTSRSKGFGFVEMPNSEEAQAAARSAGLALLKEPVPPGRLRAALRHLLGVGA